MRECQSAIPASLVASRHLAASTLHGRHRPPVGLVGHELGLPLFPDGGGQGALGVDPGLLGDQALVGPLGRGPEADGVMDGRQLRHHQAARLRQLDLTQLGKAVNLGPGPFFKLPNLYVLPNLYERLHVLPNSHMRSSVLPNLYVHPYVRSRGVHYKQIKLKKK